MHFIGIINRWLALLVSSVNLSLSLNTHCKPEDDWFRSQAISVEQQYMYKVPTDAMLSK